MEIKIEVKAKAARDKVIEQNGKFIVQTKEESKNNQANLGVIKTLAKHFGVTENQIRIIKGHKSKGKIIEVQNENIFVEKRG